MFPFPSTILFPWNHLEASRDARLHKSCTSEEHGCPVQCCLARPWHRDMIAGLFFFPSHHSSLLLKIGSSSDPRQSAFMPGSFGPTWSHICPVDRLSGLCLYSLDSGLHVQVLEGHLLLCTLMTFFVPRPKHRNTLLSALRPSQSQVREATSPLDSFLNIPLHLSFTFLVLGSSCSVGMLDQEPSGAWTVYTT